MSTRIHVIPIGGTEQAHHASLACWCHPLPIDGGVTAVHHAKDCREARERSGIVDPSRPWCHILEDVPEPLPEAVGRLERVPGTRRVLITRKSIERAARPA